MSEHVQITITADTTQAEIEMQALQAKIDAQQREWQQRRREILAQMRDIGIGIQIMIQTIREVVRATGQTLSPIQSAMLALISSTTSLIIATATALVTGTVGLLAGAALALAAFAWSFQLTTTAILIARSDEAKAALAAIQSQLSKIQRDAAIFGGTV